MSTEILITIIVKKNSQVKMMIIKKRILNLIISNNIMIVIQALKNQLVKKLQKMMNIVDLELKKAFQVKMKMNSERKIINHAISITKKIEYKIIEGKLSF